VSYCTARLRCSLRLHRRVVRGILEINRWTEKRSPFVWEMYPGKPQKARDGLVVHFGSCIGMIRKGIRKFASLRCRFFSFAKSRLCRRILLAGLIDTRFICYLIPRTGEVQFADEQIRIHLELHLGELDSRGGKIDYKFADMTSIIDRSVASRVVLLYISVGLQRKRQRRNPKVGSPNLP